MQKLAVWFDGTSVSLALKQALWVVPVVQSVHILAVCLVFSGALFVGLRSWGVAGNDWTVGQWVDRMYPAQGWALLVLLLTGTVLVLAEPIRELPNYVFQSKMVGVVIATLMSIWLGRRLRIADGAQIGLTEKAMCICMIVLWLAIIFAGRWIAYA